MPDTDQIAAPMTCACPSCVARYEPFYAQYLIPPVLMPVIQPWLDDDNPGSLAVLQHTDLTDHSHTLSAMIGAPGAKAALVGAGMASSAVPALIFGLTQPQWTVLFGLCGLLIGVGGLYVNWLYKACADERAERLAQSQLAMTRPVLFTQDDE
jgi:hypothetical protein